MKLQRQKIPEMLSKISKIIYPLLWIYESFVYQSCFGFYQIQSLVREGKAEFCIPIRSQVSVPSFDDIPILIGILQVRSFKVVDLILKRLQGVLNEKLGKIPPSLTSYLQLGLSLDQFHQLRTGVDTVAGVAWFGCHFGENSNQQKSTKNFNSLWRQNSATKDRFVRGKYHYVCKQPVISHVIRAVIFRLFAHLLLSILVGSVFRMELSFRDYFCDYCGSLLCLSSSRFFKTSHYHSSNVQLSCVQCNSSYSKGANSLAFIPLRQILKAEIIKDSDMWANASTTEERCPRCAHIKAYYLQVQTRSADEPMTTYYRCENCAHNWKD